MECQNCGQTWTGPGYDSDICPHCGEKPMRHEMDASGAIPAGRQDPERFDMSGNPLMEGIWGSIDGGWKNRMKRDESFASVKTADDDYGFDAEDWNENPAEYGGFGAEDEAAHGVHSRFIVTQDGRVLRGPTPGSNEYHENIADAHGLSDLGPDGLPEFATGPYSLGVAHNNGTIDFPQHKSGIDLGTMTQLLAQHYPEHTVDPSLQETSNEERWGLPQDIPWWERVDPSMPGKLQQTEKAEKERGQPFGYYDNPFINRGGSSRMDNRNGIFLPWNLEVEKIATDFDVVQVIPDGFHTVETDDGLVLQHEDPEKLEEAVEKVGMYKEAVPGWVLPAVVGAGGLAATALTGGAAAPLAVGAEEAALGAGAGAAAGGVAARIGIGAMGKRLMTGVMGKALGKGLGRAALKQVGFGALRGIGSHMVGGLLGGGGGGQQGAPAGGGGGGGVLPAQYLSHHQELLARLADFDHPSTDDKLTERADGDPDDVDPKEFNDGEDALAKDDTGPGGTDSIHPETLHAFVDAVPALEHYFDADESGADDPTIQKLLQAISQYDPDFFDGPDDPEDDTAADILDKAHGGSPDEPHDAPDEPSAVGTGTTDRLGATPQEMAQQALQPQAPQAAPGTQMLQPAGPGNAVNPTTQASCPSCGARMAPGSGVCPQCGAGLNAQPQQNAVPPPIPPGMGMFDGGGGGMGMPYTAANQGPASIEQIQAVVQYLQQNGQYQPGQTEQQILANPADFGDILAQIAGRGQPPTPDPDPGAPPPMPDPSQLGMAPGAMPQGAGAAPMSMTGAADNVAPRCPKCDSSTTGLVSDEGLCHCSRCNNQWSVEAELASDAPQTDSRVGYTHQELHPDHSDVEGVAAADQEMQDNPEQDINPGAWQTSDGQPLRVGQQYEMYSARYDVPDVVRISAIKPDAVEYVLTGEYGLAHRTEVTKQEADMDQLQFVPLPEEGQEAAPEPSTDSYPGSAEPVQQTNLANLRSFASVTSGKKYTPMEQREFIDEPGEARNGDKLNLAGTHYEEQNGLHDYFIFGL